MARKGADPTGAALLPSLDDMLHDMLARARPGDSVPTLRNKDLAETFRIHPSLVSRIRSGDARLTEEQARKIVSAASASDEALHQLLQASATLVGLPMVGAEALPAPLVFPGLLDRLSRGENSLILIEYRDIPKTTRSGPHADLAQYVARALASGVHAAMFQPFGSDHPPLDGPAHRYAEYVSALISAVRQNYRQLFSLAIDAWLTNYDLDPLLPDHRKTAAEKIRAHLVLYEMRGAVQLVSGLQTRLMYTEREDSDGFTREVWDWVGVRDAGSVKHGDLLVPRDADVLDFEALFDQFAPISTYWSAKKELPKTAEDVGEAYKRYAASWKGEPIGKRQWTPYSGDGVQD